MTVSPIAETYDDVQGLIYQTVGNFHRSHGGDFEEMVCVANMVFMDVYAKFDSARGCLTTVLKTSITRRLIDHMVIGGRRSKRTSSLDVTDEITGKTKAALVEARSEVSFSAVDYIKQMSSDAAAVLKLVLDAPAEVLQVVEARKETAAGWRKAIKTYLEGVGWSASRIAESFSEIGEVLQS